MTHGPEGTPLPLQEYTDTHLYERSCTIRQNLQLLSYSLDAAVAKFLRAVFFEHIAASEQMMY